MSIDDTTGNPWGSARSGELGIRVALGAPRRVVMQLVLNEGLGTVVAGLVVGVLLSAALTRFVTSLLYDTSLRDPVVLVGVAVVMIATAIAASLVPAWQAGRVDPMVALRSE